MSEAETKTAEDDGSKAATSLCGYGYLVRDGFYSRRRDDWQHKDFEVGLSDHGKVMRICWDSDEEDGLPRRRQVHLSADAVRKVLGSGVGSPAASL